MAILTQNRNTALKGIGVTYEIEVPMAVDIIFKGGMVSINAAGFAAPSSDTAGEAFLGIALEKVDNSGGSAGDEVVKVSVGGTAELVTAGLAQADVNTAVFIVDDQTVALAATTTNDIRCGTIVLFNSATSVVVALATPGNAVTA